MKVDHVIEFEYYVYFNAAYQFNFLAKWEFTMWWYVLIILVGWRTAEHNQRKPVAEFPSVKQSLMVSTLDAGLCSVLLRILHSFWPLVRGIARNMKTLRWTWEWRSCMKFLFGNSRVTGKHNLNRRWEIYFRIWKDNERIITWTKNIRYKDLLRWEP